MNPNERKSAEDIARLRWHFTADAGGCLSHEAITAAGVMATAAHVERLAATMQRIERLLLNLGEDGIHTLIRYEARRVRRAERIKRQRAAAKRKRTIAAKRAAAARSVQP